MKFRTAAIFVLTLISSGTLFSLDLTLTDILAEPLFDQSERGDIVLPGDFSHELSLAIESADSINTIHITEKDIVVESLLDAGMAAFNSNAYYMLYGTLFVEEHWIEARVSLYELETDSIRTVFYEKADSSRYDELVQSLAEKIVSYFYNAYNIEPARVLQEWSGYWDFGFSPGYWGVLPDWNNLLTGLTSLELSASLAPGKLSFFYDQFVFYPKMGFSFTYQTGLNKPEFESFLYNSFQISIPLEFCAEWRNQHFFSFQLYPGDQIDWLAQSRLYGDVVHSVSQAFFLGTGLSYQFIPEGSSWSFGINQRVDIVFYDELMIAYKPSVTVHYRLESNKNEK